MINTEKLLSLLDEDKKNLFAMDVITTANIFLQWDEERLAGEINCGGFPARIVYKLGETNSKLCEALDEVEEQQGDIEKLRVKEREMADKLLGSEEERLEYLRNNWPAYWRARHKLARGLKLEADELTIVEDILDDFGKPMPFDQIGTQDNVRD